MSDELRELLDFAHTIAWQAGKITLRHFQSGVAVDRKADESPVTVADRESEAFLRGAIADRYDKRRLQLSRELWDRVQDLQLAPGESYERLTRSLASGMRSVPLLPFRPGRGGARPGSGRKRFGHSRRGRTCTGRRRW